MNKTLEKDTIEENESEVVDNYTLTFQNNILDNEIIADLKELDLENDCMNENDEISEKCTALVTVKERRLLTAQIMFKKSIRVSLKSFLISLSLSFLNLFI